MTGNSWKFSDQLDDEDLIFMQRDFITLWMAKDYYEIGEKPFRRLASQAGAIYKIGKMVRINRVILEDYMRKHPKLAERKIGTFGRLPKED